MNSIVNKVRIIKIACNILKDLIANKWKDLFSEMRIEISLSPLLTIPIVFSYVPDLKLHDLLCINSTIYSLQ